MQTLKYYWFYIKNYFPTKINNIKKKFYTKVKDHIIKKQSDWLSERISNDYVYEHVMFAGETRQMSMYFPLYSVMCAIYQVYDTMMVPVSGIWCNVAEVDLSQPKSVVEVHITTDKPGVIIGKNGELIDKLQRRLEHMFNCSKVEIKLIECKQIHEMSNY